MTDPSVYACPSSPRVLAQGGADTGFPGPAKFVQWWTFFVDLSVRRRVLGGLIAWGASWSPVAVRQLAASSVVMAEEGDGNEVSQLAGEGITAGVAQA